MSIVDIVYFNVGQHSGIFAEICPGGPPRIGEPGKYRQGWAGEEVRHRNDKGMIGAQGRATHGTARKATMERLRCLFW